MGGEVGGGVEVGARVAARAPAVDEVVAHRVGRDPVPARVERRVDVRGQGGDLRVRGDEIVRRRQAAAGRQPDQRVAARADRAGARPAMVQAADLLQRAAPVLSRDGRRSPSEGVSESALGSRPGARVSMCSRGLDRRRLGAPGRVPRRRPIALTERARGVNNRTPCPTSRATRRRGQIRSDRHVTFSRTIRAGLPAATQWGGTVPVTTACAPTIALSPMTVPLRSVA